MPKTKQQKQTTVQTLVEGIKGAKSVIFANFQGLTVAQTEDLRKKCRIEGIQMVAAKKTLVKRALKEVEISSSEDYDFAGGVATFLGANDEVSAARVVNSFAKNHEMVTIFGGILEGRFIDSVKVKNLANLPSKQELLSKMVGSLAAPISGFARVLNGTIVNLVGVLQNIKNSKN